MFKRRFCEAAFQWDLECDGPLLIRDERYAEFKGDQRQGFPSCIFMSHISRREMASKAPQWANSPPQGLPYYVPGTSIRGPFRALAERIIRSLMPEDALPPFTACDPFEQEAPNTIGCSTRLVKGNEDKTAYAAACPACKLFGCAGLASRIRFADAEILLGTSVYRDMIGIDRFTGGVYTGGDSGSGANMRLHALENTSFTTTVTVTNFELWQLGLLAYAFRDFEMCLVPIGFGKTKGFGQVRGKVSKIVLTYPSAQTRIDHVGSLMINKDERHFYGLHDYDAPAFDHLDQGRGSLSLFQSVSVTDTAAFWTAVVPAFNAYIKELDRKAKENDK
jgi:CRISPR/Cas system CSM-associated protein Csm3 (group 7 of RAMP superfamily)